MLAPYSNIQGKEHANSVVRIQLVHAFLINCCVFFLSKYGAFKYNCVLFTRTIIDKFDTLVIFVNMITFIVL